MRIAASAALILALVAVDTADAAAKAKPRLKAFSSCRSLVAYARAGAERTDGGIGVVPRAVPAPPVTITTPPLPTSTTIDSGTSVGGIVPPMAAAPVSARGESDTAVPDFSGTNTQEADVDEPDVIKTDGRRIFTVTDGTLRVIDAASGAVTGTLALDGNEHRLLLRGDRVLVIASKGASPTGVPIGRPVAPTVAPIATTTIVTEVDVAAAPAVMRTMEVPGRFVDARQNGAVARLVIDSVPQPIAQPQAASLRRFMGKTVLKSKLTGRTFRRNLAPCDAVTHPSRFSGLDVLAILTIDLDRGMYSLDRDGVMAGAQVVYGSTGSLYVATRRYVRAVELGQDAPEGLRTEIHRFDVSDPTKTTYRASGSVPGFILNNYALSEFEGDLRVASTEESPWSPGTAGTTASRVTVLRQAGSRLNPVGAVGGLGQGERIYAVRFMGERGYVVTFRQIDPLYTLDLSDPAAPKVAGELKIPGYSAYLHPVGENRLLGIGREGQNVKASLFDVSDMAAPRELTNLQFPNGSTAVENEPHAFLYWAPKELAVLPLTSYSPPFTGAVGVRVGAGTLSEAGRITHKTDARPDFAPVERSLVIGDKLYSLSYLGLAASSVDSLAPLGYTAF
jgi:uncharacterized secreted protein with C-terminal beta-propeller domain